MAQNLIGTIYDDNGHPVASTQTGRTATGLSTNYAALAVTGSANPANALASANVIPVAAMAWNGSSFDLPGAVSGGVTVVADGGTTTTPITAGTATNTVVKASPGRLCKVLITGNAGTTTGNTSIYDNASAASGTVIGILPNNSGIGVVYTFNMPAANGVTVGGSTNAPAMTVSFV